MNQVTYGDFRSVMADPHWNTKDPSFPAYGEAMYSAVFAQALEIACALAHPDERRFAIRQLRYTTDLGHVSAHATLDVGFLFEVYDASAVVFHLFSPEYNDLFGTKRIVSVKMCLGSPYYSIFLQDPPSKVSLERCIHEAAWEVMAEKFGVEYPADEISAELLANKWNWLRDPMYTHDPVPVVLEAIEYPSVPRIADLACHPLVRWSCALDTADLLRNEELDRIGVRDHDFRNRVKRIFLERWLDSIIVAGG